MKKINKPNMIILILIILVCFVSVGYSYLETSMSVGGVAEIKGVPKGFTVDYLIKKANPITVTDYNAGNKGEMYTFNHPATAQTPALTDYRYIGNTPNNYITFNNETWRIIGVFDGKIKIIRDESIGDYQWDDDINEWTTSTLKTELNSGDYWGGLTSTAKEQIVSTEYYLGGRIDSSGRHGTGSDMYSWERGTTVYSGRSVNWNGIVGLMYPSDYIYTYANGVDNICFNDSYNCYTSKPSSSWLYSSSEVKWTISPLSDLSDNVFAIHPYFFVYRYFVNTTGVNVYPVVYLKSDIVLTGSGTIANPYIILS